MAWSLEQELRTAAANQNGTLIDVLADLQLIPSGEQPPIVTLEIGAWRQGGAETYILPFTVLSPPNEWHYLLKACTSLGGGGVAYVHAQWLSRRNLLDAKNISTSRHYGGTAATGIEELIPYTLKEAVAKSSISNRQKLVTQIAQLGRTLTQLGFAPISLHDLRSRGSDVVLVDFGSDLGPPYAHAAPHAHNEILLAQTAAMLGFTREEMALIRTHYRA